MGLFKGAHLGVANLKVHIMLWDYSVIPLGECLHSGSLQAKRPKVERTQTERMSRTSPYWVTGDVAFVHSLSRR